MKHILMARVIALLLTCGLAQAMYAQDEGQTQHKNQLVVTVGETSTTYNLADSPVITFTSTDAEGSKDQMVVTVGSSDPTTYSFSTLSNYSFTYGDIDVSVTLTDPGDAGTYYCTFSNAESCRISNTDDNGLVPYYASKVETSEGAASVVTLTAVPAESEGGYLLAANTGYLFKATSSSYTIKTYGFDVTAPEGNQFIPCLNGLTATSDDNIWVLNYVSTGTEGGAGYGFYKLNTNGTLDPGKAYLTGLSAGTSSDGVKLSFGDANDGETTGITNVNAAVKGDGYIYDLSGRRVSAPTKGGVYIKDGKKVIF